jgi:hypothetical protein
VIASLSQTAQAVLHYVDQPHVVKALQKASWPLGVTMAGATASQAVSHADNKPREAAKQAAVIGAALAGTALATHKLNFSELPALKTLTQDTVQLVSHHLGDDMAQLASKPQKSLPEFKTLVSRLEKATHLTPAKRQQLKNAMLPPPDLEDDPMHEVRHFMKLGAASVGSGLVGGIAANAATGQKSQIPAQLKEGAFQMGVNIGMCGAGAAAGIKAAEAMGHAASRTKRIGWIGAGLAAGIAGGNVASNVLEKAVIDPLAKATGQTSLVDEPARRVHGDDMAMHVDDLPLMLMFAGVEAVKPVIPLCFLNSGIKTGVAASNQAGQDKVPHVINQTFSGQLQTHPTAFKSFNAVG